MAVFARHVCDPEFSPQHQNIKQKKKGGRKKKNPNINDDEDDSHI